MSQSNFIVGALFVVFIVYITIKGRLPMYMATLGIGGNSLSATGTGIGGTGIGASGSGGIDLHGMTLTPIPQQSGGNTTIDQSNEVFQWIPTGH